MKRTKTICLVPEMYLKMMKERLNMIGVDYYYRIDNTREKETLINELSRVKILILFDLIPINSASRKQENICIGVIWYRYLRLYHPEIKLLIASQRDAKGKKYDSYIDLLSEDLSEERLEKIPTLSEFKVEKRNLESGEVKFEEKWIVEKLLNYRLNINDTLKQFFNGHDSESLLKHLAAIKLKMTVVNAVINSEYDDKMEYEEIIKEKLEVNGKEQWKRLFQRWKNYEPYLKYLPFTDIILKIDFKTTQKYFRKSSLKIRKEK